MSVVLFLTSNRFLTPYLFLATKQTTISRWFSFLPMRLKHHVSRDSSILNEEEDNRYRQSEVTRSCYILSQLLIFKFCIISLSVTPLTDFSVTVIMFPFLFLSKTLYPYNATQTQPESFILP